uniref:Uncharacterized protein n=1 Tax=Ditylum brightwellii TaxID=49249 RepID=A0A7S4W3V6_9STRA|mmetsp:Transcript_56614/g.84196  ORF Transcript_56614/g.84196 Transcript_56614/m.84196 type:complete len:101 (-) Transcript_56614:261-563(-)
MCPLCAVFALQALQQENAALCFVCIVMAAYISNKVQMEKGSDIEEDGTFYQADFSNTKNNSAARINKMLCLDPLLICDFTFVALGGFAFCCSAMCLWRRR